MEDIDASTALHQHRWVRVSITQSQRPGGSTVSSDGSCWSQTGEKKLDWKHNTRVECDIGSVLHKEGSPPSNVNTAVHVCRHLRLLPLTLEKHPASTRQTSLPLISVSSI